MAEKRYTRFDELPLTLTVPEVAEVLDIACSKTIWSGI